MTTNTISPVAVAVEPLRAAAVERAKIEGRRIAGAYLAKFAADPKLAQYPRGTGSMGKLEYNLVMSTYRIIQSLTTALKDAYRQEDRTVVADPAKVEIFVNDCGERAEKEYTAFVAKLEIKVGTCDAAELTGDHVWGYSFLRVTKGSDVTVWKTQQIVNVSVLGKCFNQWPTRKVKNA